MSDSIIVRVTLGSYDVVHPSEKQTQVYVQIPEVARASWLLPEDHFHFSQREPWPNVVDSAQEYYERRGTVSDSKSAAARATVVKWLADDANHDAMRAAWELDEARRHPVARKLLGDKGQLTAELEQRARDLADIAGERDKLRVRVTELEAAPPAVPAAYELATRAHLGAQLREVLDRCAKRARQAEMPLRRDLIARGMGLLSALHLVEEGSANNTEQDGEFAGYDEDADPPGGFPDAPIPYTDPAGYPAKTLLERRGVRPAREADGITRRIAPVQALREGETADEPTLTVFRASWDSLILGHYTTDKAAREHCKKRALRDLPSVSLDWIEDEEDGVAELVGSVGEEERPLGYVVTALEVASAYEEEADE